MIGIDLSVTVEQSLFLSHDVHFPGGQSFADDLQMQKSKNKNELDNQQWDRIFFTSLKNQGCVVV